MNHLSTTTVQAEQSQTSWHFTWWQKKSRQLVMNFLSSISGAGLTLWEDNQSHFFGDKNAQLQAEIEILDKRFYTQIIKGGSIALAEEFIQQTWTTDDLTALIQVFARNQKESDSIENLRSFLSRTKHKLTHVLNKNSIKQSKKNILAHYDLGNQLYTRFLDLSCYSFTESCKYLQL